MSRIQRIKNIFTGLFLWMLSLIMLCLDPEDGFQIAAGILAVVMTCTGVKYLSYYFTMAKHMVGGKMMLYLGLIVLDFGIFTMTLTNIPHIYLIVYLLGTHAFSGAIDIMRALEAKKNGASWKLNMSTGIVNILVTIRCLFSLRSIGVLVAIYCSGLIYSGFVKIISAFRKTAIVYIQ